MYFAVLVLEVNTFVKVLKKGPFIVNIVVVPVEHGFSDAL